MSNRLFRTGRSSTNGDGVYSALVERSRHRGEKQQQQQQKQSLLNTTNILRWLLIKSYFALENDEPFLILLKSKCHLIKLSPH